ncbi:MAG: C-GCAxxG-C-C family protein [Bacteroidales bacterium]
MKKQDQALEYFWNKFNCAQSVFTPFGKEHGLDEAAALKLSCAFGAGMGRQQFTCGAVTGALMAIGLKYGKAIGDPEEKKLETYAKTREFFEAFKAIHGSTSCRTLLNDLDLNDPGDHKKIEELGLFRKNCDCYVKDAVRLAEEL